MPIPKNVHYVWVGPKPFPASAMAFVNHWKQLMPDFSFYLWTESNIDFSSKFIRQAYGARAYNRVANYARLAALRDYGGIYMDHDIELLKPLYGILDNECLLGFQTMDRSSKDAVNNAFIGAVPDHPFILRALARLDSMDGARDWLSDTGPGLLSKLLRESGELVPSVDRYELDGVSLYPPRYFYPYEWTEQFSPECIKDDTVAIHHWDHTWKAKPGFYRRVVKKAFRELTRLSPTFAYRYVRILNRIDRWRKLRKLGRS